MDLTKLSNVFVHEPFPMPFIYEVLKNFGGQDAHSFIDIFLGYHQIKVTRKDFHKMAFSIVWGSFQYIFIPFGMKIAPTIFSEVVVIAFKELIRKLLEVYLDDWTIFSLLKKHIEVL